MERAWAGRTLGGILARHAEGDERLCGCLERAVRSVDGAVRSIATRTKAAADSAMSLTVQAPTFKKVKIADNPPPER